MTNSNCVQVNSLFSRICSGRLINSAIVPAVILIVCVVFAGPHGTAHARGGYASWLKHGDAYRVTGDFVGYKGSIVVQVKWRGNRFVVSTPIGTFPLKRAGSGVTFQVKFEKIEARVTWVKTRVHVVSKGRRGTAVVSKMDNRRTSPKIVATL